MKLATWFVSWKADSFVALSVLFSLFGSLFVTLVWTQPVALVAGIFDRDPSRDFASEWGVPAWIIMSIAFGPGILRKMLGSFNQQHGI